MYIIPRQINNSDLQYKKKTKNKMLIITTAMDQQQNGQKNKVMRLLPCCFSGVTFKPQLVLNLEPPHVDIMQQEKKQTLIISSYKDAVRPDPEGLCTPGQVVNRPAHLQYQTRVQLLQFKLFKKLLFRRSKYSKCGHTHTNKQNKNPTSTTSKSEKET